MKPTKQGTMTKCECGAPVRVIRKPEPVLACPACDPRW
jgi:hypothetical protein